MDPVSQCLKAIDEGRAVAAGIRCFESFASAPNGLIPLPKTGEKEIGNHAVCLCGYSIPEKCFIFANSWGEDWGNKGMGKLPFSYFEQGLVLEMIYIDSNNPKRPFGGLTGRDNNK